MNILLYSLQHRTNPQELDNEALALLPVLGAMLSRVYNNPINREENQTRLQKIVQFWASKEVFNQSTISTLEREMKASTSIAHASVDIPTLLPSGLSLSLSLAHNGYCRYFIIYGVLPTFQ